MMKTVFSLFARKSVGFYVFIILTSVFNSGLNSAFMIIIGKVISNGSYSAVNGRDTIIFLGLLVSCFVINYIFNSYIIRVSTSMVYEIELGILRRIKDTSFRNLGVLGKEKVYAAIGSLNVLGEAPVKFINLFNPLLTVLFCVGYLYWTSPVYGLLMTILIAVLIGAYLLEIKKNVRKYQFVHELNVNYHSYLSDLLLGFKDLKMSSLKSENIYSHNILKNRAQSESIITRLRTNNYNSGLVTSYVWYLLLGVVLFVFPKVNQLNLPNTSSFIIILIYIIAPVSTIVGIFPFYSQLKAAAKELDSVNTILSEHEFGRVQNTIPNLPEFSRIQFKDVYFEYFDETQGKTFSLEPLNVEFCSGQVVFVVGGNGSGKSTFLNLFAGLYKPTSGSILFNEQSIDDNLYTEYRSKIAPVFFDGYLLNHNYEKFDLTDKNEVLVRYLNLMKLTAVVTPGSIFNSKDRLSKGQQKRLALILALLMERKILILDEWASEQDPAFKDYFYKTVIPFLRKEGRTIIAITHDDEYFSCADRVIKFTDGRVVYDHYMSQVTAQ